VDRQGIRYAQQYTLCDNYFTEVASQSEPNHLMLIAAASPVARRNRGRCWNQRAHADIHATHSPASRGGDTVEALGAGC
jgi:phospholipase C